jgi:hypothetical protein
MENTDIVIGQVSINLNITESLVSNILITAFDGYYGACHYWATVDKIIKNDAEDLLDEVWYSAIIREREGEEDDVTLITVDAKNIIRGIEGLLATSSSLGLSIGQELLKAITTNDAGYIDADVADCVVQIAALGQVTYS